MIKPVQITQGEKELLLYWRRYGCSPLIRDRAHAVLLNSHGFSAYRISKLLFRTDKAVRNWLSRFKQYRISSLFTKYRGNTNANKLTREQKEEIKKALNSPPSDYGIPKSFWTTKDLKKFIKAEFGVIYESDRSYHFLLKLSRLSWRLPDKFDVKRDDQFVKRRIKEIRREIAPLLKDERWVVLTSDETRIILESELRRAWLKTGQKTIVKVKRERKYQNFLGSLNLKSRKCHLHSLSWQNQKEIIKALSRLKSYYQGKRICLVWDNARWHKGKLVRKELKRGGLLDNFHLINFPPYAPDTNPQEYVWKYAKDKIANNQSVDFRRTINRFKLAVIHRKFNYQI